MKKQILTLLTVFSVSLVFPQYKIGQWVDYLPYNSVLSVTKGNGKVYAATGNSVFAVNWGDNSFERLNKIYGLSDVGATIVRFNEYNNTLMIVYSNSNIDILKDGNIINFSDIQRKNITADKTIHHVSFYQELAYIATGFGVVVFDTDKLEFKDTYIIGTNGGYLTVYDAARSANTIYAATPQGLKQASVASNLSDFQNWSLVPGLPALTFNAVARYNNEIIANYSAKMHFGQSLRDTLYVFDGSAWSVFPKTPFDSSNTYEILRIVPDEATQRVFITTQWQVEEYIKQPGWVRTNAFSVNNFPDANGNFIDPYMTEGVYTPGFGSNQYCVGSAAIGLFRTDGWYYERLIIDGPGSNRVGQISILKDKMVVAPIWLTDVWFNQYAKTGVYTMNNGSWKNITKHPVGDSVYDINCVAFVNNDPDHYFAGSWDYGVLEFRADTLYKIYNHINSSLQASFTTTNLVRVNGVTSDSSGNIWVTNAFTTKCLSVLKPNGSWQNMNFGNYIANNNLVGKIMIDKNNQKWILLPGVGFLVYNDGGTYAPPNNSNTKKITIAPGGGGLPSQQVTAICEDLESDIWVGSDKGVAVFYNPESILSSTSGWDAQQIIIDQNGIAKILLETETVLDIVVDGQNRKWIATKTGVYCLSADGQKQIYHFTVENSPLFANTVVDLEYNGKTGDIFFGTTAGIQSFRTEVIDAYDEFTDVYSYPNPVRPGYDGPIVIKGMVQDAVVKITDITGTLVYETTSKGGQALWYAKNFKGERVSSGIYVVFCSGSDGEQKTLTKILVVN